MDLIMGSPCCDDVRGRSPLRVLRKNVISVLALAPFGGHEIATHWMARVRVSWRFAIVCLQSHSNCPVLLVGGARRSTLLVRVEDVVLRLYRHVACMPAVGFRLVGGHL